MAVMTAFQGINECRITLELSLEQKGFEAWMVADARAWSVADESTGALPSVLASAQLSSGKGMSLTALLMQALYKLDTRLERPDGVGSKGR